MGKSLAHSLWIRTPESGFTPRPTEIRSQGLLFFLRLFAYAGGQIIRLRMNRTPHIVASLASIVAAALFACGSLTAAAADIDAAREKAAATIIFDTDIGNDVDDVLALGMLHVLQDRGDCRLLAVTITKRDEDAGPFVDAINTFYGHPDVPIGCRHGPSDGGSRFLPLVEIRDGDHWRYPHHLLRSSDAPDASTLLRRVLAAQPDGSVVLVQVGYFSNFAALLDTPADSLSDLGGLDLVKRKVKFLSVMAGSFQTIDDGNHYLEFNVTSDIPAAQKLARQWPTSIVWSGFEIGIAVPFPAVSIERDFSYVPHHPLRDAYYAYIPPPHERPTWDLTATLYAVLSDRNYFSLSAAGSVSVAADGFTTFNVKEGGRDRFLKLDLTQAASVREAFVQLCSTPPRP